MTLATKTKRDTSNAMVGYRQLGYFNNQYISSLVIMRELEFCDLRTVCDLLDCDLLECDLLECRKPRCKKRLTAEYRE